MTDRKTASPPPRRRVWKPGERAKIKAGVRPYGGRWLYVISRDDAAGTINLQRPGQRAGILSPMIYRLDELDRYEPAPADTPQDAAAEQGGQTK